MVKVLTFLSIIILTIVLALNLFYIQFTLDSDLEDNEQDRAEKMNQGHAEEKKLNYENSIKNSLGDYNCKDCDGKIEVIGFSYGNKIIKQVLTNIKENNNLPVPLRTGDRFKNPWSTWKETLGVWSILKYLIETDNSDIPSQEVLDDVLPISEPNFNFSGDSISFTWIGHSTFLLHLDGITIIADPIFSERASISQMAGPARYRRAAVKVDQLPSIDAVIISHNHYDHLDLNSVQDLNARFGSKLHWMVPLGLSKWMSDVGCAHVIEFDWWQSYSIPHLDNINFIFTPAQHSTKRGAFDDCKVLWGSWTLIGPKHRFYFAGDTGYCTVFEQIGRMYGPFDLAAIPIGAYEPRWLMEPHHVDPGQAVQIHKDIRSKLSVGIHWGTFALAHEYYLEPPIKLRKALKEEHLGNQFICISHGQTINV